MNFSRQHFSSGKSIFKVKESRLILVLVALCALYTPNSIASTDPFKIQKTTCDYQIEPLLASTQPFFGWIIESKEKNFIQSAYRIELYELAANKRKKIWDTGKVESDLSQQIKYNGKQPLKAGIWHEWRVKVWNQDGKSSRWSKTSKFKRSPDNLLPGNAQWIGAIDKRNSLIPAGRNYHALSPSSETAEKWRNTDPLSRRSIYLRKEFSTKKEIADAIIYVSGLGHYELTLNGEKLDDTEFSPLWSDYDKTVYYNAYEVTQKLKSNNAVGVLLGNGFFNEQGGRYAKMQVSFGPPTLFFILRITYNDGSIDVVPSDNTWKYAFSPLVFNDMYGGEDYDARLKQNGWDKNGFNDSEWKPAVIQSAPKGQLTPQTAPPVKVMEYFSPVSVKNSGTSYIFDMGQNLSGFPKIKVKGKAGDKIRLAVGENVHQDGTVNQAQSGSPYYYNYTLNGEGEEIWHPRFTYYGYKYIQIDGAIPSGEEKTTTSRLPVIEDVQSCFVYNSAPQAGSFHCSNKIFNQAHRIIVNAIKSNMQAVFTDCPHREKLGWLEQMHLNGPGLFYNFDLSLLAPKIMQDIRDAQLPNGLVPDIAPEYVIFDDGFRDSPEWGSTAVFLPFMYYHFYGDSTLITEYYEVMKRYVDYLSSTATDHIVSHGLGDWCDYRENEPYGPSKNTPIALSASAHYYMTIDYLVKAAQMTNRKNDFIKYNQLREEVKAAFNNKFFDVATQQYGTGSQASNAMPLFAGLVEDKYKNEVLDNLVKDIKDKGFRLSTGDVGNRYLFQALASNGLNEIMYKIHNHREVPGYGFQLQFGATTLTELWDPRDGASWNHFMMGQIEEWFFKSLAGITSDNESGFKNFVIAPQPVGDLTFVDASYETLYRKISVNWKINGNRFEMNLSVPANCTAKVYLPNENEYKTAGSGNHHFEQTTTLSKNFYHE